MKVKRTDGIHFLCAKHLIYTLKNLMFILKYLMFILNYLMYILINLI